MHESAEELREKLAESLSVPVNVHENRENRKYQVWVGEFSTREEARDYWAKELRTAGYRDYLIVQGEVSAANGELTLALRGPKNLFRISKTGFLFFPESASDPLRLNRKPYRGILELSLNGRGSITVINQLGIEEYLLGVVPAEISPDSYPESAALAAQSIAARTYALKNAGRYRSEGFDLTADIRSQVYSGMAGEKEASSDAVRRTFGLAIYYHDQLIDAMYSSTCGGRTEDYSNVFDAPPVPYLKGVVCTAEAGPEREGGSLTGAHDLSGTVFTDDGIPANRSLELARILGIGDPDRLSAQWLARPVTTDQAVRWTGQAGNAAGRNSDARDSTGPDLTSRGAFLRYAAESLFGEAEIERRISNADASYYLANLKDGDTVPQPARKAIAYLIQQGLWRPDPENRVRPDEPMRRLDALSLLMRWTESLKPTILRKGVFAGFVGSVAGEPTAGIYVKSGNKIQQVAFSVDVRLFLASKSASTPTDDLRMIGNEKVSFHLTNSGKIDFLEVELNPTGASSDRYSPVASWDVTMTRAVLAEKIRPLAEGIGEFRDLKPWKMGTSGRAVQIQVIGTRRSVVLNGYKVRNAIGLRDTLFTISRSVGVDGSIQSFTFHGRGWGHGVGLCQVGAFGMARAGKSYEEILKTYYQGVEIRRAY